MAQARFSRHRDTQSSTTPYLPKSPSAPTSLGRYWDFWAVRLALLAVTSALCYNLGPFGIHGLPAAGLGFLVAMLILLAELRLRRAEISGLVGGAFGAILGLLASLLVALVVSRTAEPEPTKSFLELTSLFVFGYLGLAIGSSVSKRFDLHQIPLPHSVEIPATGLQAMKLLDTSALIDGRIADICATHFLDGTLGIPRFVLHELQHVADSSDALKRQRGRRGLEVLEHMQKMTWLDIRILEDEIPAAAGVDQKLMELARHSGSKIVTNDFNLNKVARVQGISILNVNELANAMKPAVLPGESMRVLILREGKESTQGVAYLDDGTMVVVDGARRFINRTIDIVVTSTHQTPAGKMIFGRVEERSDSSAARVAAGPMPQVDSTPPGNGHGQTETSSALRFETPPPAAYPVRDPH
ncbi:MAG: PIN domain-containing protein [Candidatus Acidiferrum sp.]